MLAVVKTPHIDLCIRGKLSARLLNCLKSEFGTQLRIEVENKTTDFFQSNLFRKTKAELTPGTYVRIYRQNLRLTQADLGKKLGVSKAFVCDLERNRRSISKTMAQMLAKLFQVDITRFF